MAALRLGDRLAQETAAGFVGRSAELAVLLQALEEDGQPVIAVHGIGGCGKTSLLDAFAVRARALGAAVVRLECGGIEPTERGFLQELAGAIGAGGAGVDEVAERLSGLAGRVVLALDSYEVFRLLDTWLRQVFVPALGSHVRVLLVGRESPAAAWLASPGWHGLFRSLPLRPLADPDALEVLRRAGVGEAQARRINRFARGYPLALKLAAAAIAEQPDLEIESGATQRVLEELTRVYLAGVEDPLLRSALDAACVLRRVTVSLLRALLPEAAPQDAYERLAALPFVSTDRDGLHIHDSVRETIAAVLQSADPSRYQSLCRSAWRQLREEVRAARPADLWRYTADILYLLQNPVVRGAFFPPDPHSLAVEPARPADGAAILAIIGAQQGPQAAAWLRGWWEALPEAFFTVRDAAGTVVGLYVLFNAAAAPRRLLAGDPVLQGWLRHLRSTPVAAWQQVLFSLGWLSRDQGELPSPEQAACWLDIKRSYMELRPTLRRLYMPLRALDTYGPVAQRLGFRVVPEAQVVLDGAVYHTVYLDFGPASVDGWLAGLVAAELGIAEDELLDAAARELAVEGRRVPLTKLEFGVMQRLTQSEGKVVTRATLVEEVWGYKGGDSNVVEVAIKGLRKKLGERAAAIETVRGAGYRFRGT